MKNTTLFGICLSMLILSACGSKEEPKIPEMTPPMSSELWLTKDQYEHAGIAIGKLEHQKISSTLKANGMLDVPPQNLISITFPFPAYVKETDMLEGMHVKKGQKIALLEHPDFIQVQQDYLDYKSQLTYLQQDYDRQQELAKENVNANKTLQKAKSELESMKARVYGLTSKLKMMNVSITKLDQGKISSIVPLYAPMDGYITAVNTNVGAFVSPTDVIFKLANTQHLHAEISVYEADVPKLKVGQLIKIKLANESTERDAKIYLIGKEITGNRTVKVHCHFMKEDPSLMPGVFLKALISINDGNLAVLHKKAVVQYHGEHFIFYQITKQSDVKKVNAPFAQFKMLKVEVGVSEGDFIEVKNIENENWIHQIVVNGSYALLSVNMNKAE